MCHYNTNLAFWQIFSHKKIVLASKMVAKRPFCRNIFDKNAKHNIMQKSNMWKNILFGGLIGVANGFFGGGGGMIAVPILLSLLDGDEKKAHASAIFVMLPISIASAIIYITTKQAEFGASWWTILGLTIGGVIGAWLLPKLKNKYIKWVFVVLMFASGIYMLVK